MAQMTIITGPERGRTVELNDADGPITFGRESCSVVLADAAVSRRHAELARHGGQWVMVDLDSSNGTFVNEHRITEEVVLAPGDQVRCGATVLLFEANTETRSKQQTPVATGAGEDGRAETMVGLTFGTLVPKSSARRREQAAAAGFAALNLSHGIKNLLQMVTSGREVVDMALSINDIERARRAWMILNRSLDQINRLILDLLKFSRDTRPVLKACPLNQLLAQLVSTAVAQADRKGVAISLDADANVGDVPLDAGLMSEALLNVVLNAIEAVEGGKGALRIATRLDEAEGKAVITFEDNGCGIEDTAVIFEPFHTAGKKDGTGLGLPIARKIIEQHAGTIRAESRPGDGTVVTVALPLQAQRERGGQAS